MAQKPRNSMLTAMVNCHSRSAMYVRRGLFKRRQAIVNKKEAAPATTKVVSVGGDKNGKQRTVSIKKAPKFYPAEDVSVPLKSHKTPKPSKLRASITPGTVLILLAGKYAGKRVVFLKQLPSGLLLVSGPRKLNGVPLKRVNAAYVMATSTKVDVSKVTLSEELNDALFKKPADKKGNAEFFAEEEKTKKVDEARIKLQKTVDDQLLPIVKKVPMLPGYLKTRFSLQRGQAPHSMKF